VPIARLLLPFLERTGAVFGTGRKMRKKKKKEEEKRERRGREPIKGFRRSPPSSFKGGKRGKRKEERKGEVNGMN